MHTLSHGLSGTAGEFYVAAELSRRGFLATITNKNAEGIDILAARPGSGLALKLQVKTSQHSKVHWVLREKDEEGRGRGFFYVFVSLGAENSRPDFFIVPGEVVADTIKRGHKAWLAGKKKDGSTRKDTSMRGFGYEAVQYKEAWQLFEEAANG